MVRPCDNSTWQPSMWVCQAHWFCWNGIWSKEFFFQLQGSNSSNLIPQMAGSYRGSYFQKNGSLSANFLVADLQRGCCWQVRLAGAVGRCSNQVSGQICWKKQLLLTGALTGCRRKCCWQVLLLCAAGRRGWRALLAGAAARCCCQALLARCRWQVLLAGAAGRCCCWWVLFANAVVGGGGGRCWCFGRVLAGAVSRCC